MKKLIFCNTYSQLILSIQLKLTLFKQDNVDLWLSDSSVGIEEVYNRVRAISLFNDVKFLRLKHFNYEQSYFSDFKDLFTYNFGPIKNKYNLYDEVVFYNMTMFVFTISDYYHKIGHKAIWSKMEEGIFSYNTDFGRSKRVHCSRFIRKFIKRPDVTKMVSKYYCLFPSVKETHLEWEMIKIPNYSTHKEELLKYLNYIFDYKPIQYNYKYIFFASSTDIDHTPYGETDLVIRLSELLGKDNLLVKMHPRDTRTVYSDNGIRVMKNSSIPWEVMQMNMDMNDCCLLTGNSGSFISISAMMNQSVKGYFLYNAVHSNDSMFIFRKGQISTMLKKLHKLGICKDIVDTVTDINQLCLQK